MTSEYFVLGYDDRGIERGVPKMLRGKLNNSWQWDEFDPDPWKFDIVADYEYRAKHTVVDFDFSANGTLVSEGFARLCERYGMVIRRIPVRMVQSTGQPSKKNYVYMLTSTWVPVLDMGKSVYSVAKKMDTGEPVYNRSFPAVPHLEIIDKAVIDGEKMDGFGIVKACDILAEYVCTVDFKEACEKENMLGINFIPVEDFTYRGFGV